MKPCGLLRVSAFAVLLAASAAEPGLAEKSPAHPRSASPQSALAEAVQAGEAGNASLALAKFSEAIESKALAGETLAVALLNRALTFQGLRQFQDSVDDYSAALRLDALDPKTRAIALYNRALAYQKLNKPALAIDDLTNALFLDVEFGHAYYSRGNVLRETGQFLFALSDYEKALRFGHPQPHLPLYGEALTHHALKRPDAARRSLARVLTIKSDFEPARELLARLGGEANPQEGPETVGGTRPVEPAAATRPARPAAPADAQAERAEPAVDLPEGKDPAAASKGKAAGEAERGGDVRTAAINAMVAPAAARAETGAKSPASWLVQLSSQRNEKTAWDVWEQINSKHGAALKGAKPLVVAAEVRGRGTYYRLRLAGFDAHDEAARLCGRLKGQGTACFVTRGD
jgi:tetratricopeptide (TPR) repeat protein